VAPFDPVTTITANILRPWCKNETPPPGDWVAAFRRLYVIVSWYSVAE
jgi:hypothetical protein